MKIVRYLLFPIAILYGLVIRLRHWLYDSGVWHSQSFATPTICVGNVRVGGTGKSPMTEYLIALLQQQHRVGVLSRGYKRKSNGLVIADANATADTLGDEPFQFWTKFPTITLAVDADRRRGITALESLNNPPEIIILDDAMQHRKVKPSRTIVLTAYGQLYRDDFLLPTGWLRDTTSRADQADLIVVTKCPEHITENEMITIKKRLQKNNTQAVFFAKIAYSETVQNTDGQILLSDFIKKPFILITGIADASPLVRHLSAIGATFEHWEYSDHHDFTSLEINKISTSKIPVLTTEKDYMRLHTQVPKVHYLPITMDFVLKEEKEKFDSLIRNYAVEK